MSFLRRLYATPPLLWAALVYACGIGIRLIYTLSLQRPENFIYSDMGLYVGLARRMVAHVPLSRPDVTHPLGYATLLSFLMSSTYDLGRDIRNDSSVA